MKGWIKAASIACALASGTLRAQTPQAFADWSPPGYEHLAWAIVTNDSSKQSFYTYYADKFLVQYAMKAGYLGTDGSITHTMTVSANFICFPDGSSPHYLQNVMIASYGPTFQSMISPQKLSNPLPIDSSPGLAQIVSAICKDVAAAKGTKALQ